MDKFPIQEGGGELLYSLSLHLSEIKLSTGRLVRK